MVPVKSRTLAQRNERMNFQEASTMTETTTEALLASGDEHDNRDEIFSPQGALLPNPDDVYRNFIRMAIFFSIHHGCVVSCLSLATARLGADVGATQSSLLYLSYTGSALVGATYITKRWGAHRALITGLFLYCFYVGAFGLAAHGNDNKTLVAWMAYIGAIMGGLGAGLVWTAQGSFFAQAAQTHARTAAVTEEGFSQQQEQDSITRTTDSDDRTSQSTAQMAGVFAFFYLGLELLLRSLSSLASWKTVFNLYGVLTVVSTLCMVLLVKPPNLSTQYVAQERPSASLLWYQITAAIQLWKPSTDGHWPVMPLMLGLNAVFGLESAFLNAYINGQVVAPESVGLWTAWASGVAALWSLVFGKLTSNHGANNHSIWSNRKGWVLSAGAVCFASVLLPFAVAPNVTKWSTRSSLSWWVFFLIYSLHGTGRATFEGTLKATFADFFVHEKEGAFANIILQNGLASSFGFFLTSRLACDPQSAGAYCVPYRDGSYHHLGAMQLLVFLVAIFAILGYWKAAHMVKEQQEQRNREGGESAARETNN